MRCARKQVLPQRKCVFGWGLALAQMRLKWVKMCAWLLLRMAMHQALTVISSRIPHMRASGWQTLQV
jgi:hypothetical protein